MSSAHLPHYRSSLLSVEHGFFGRLGGVSTDGCASLNCSFSPPDKRENVVENRARIAGHLASSSSSPLCCVKQVHSAICVPVREPWSAEDAPEADALVTDQKGIILGVMTADCGSILFQGKKQDGSAVIGAAHAGWQGALNGVLENTVLEMTRLGAHIDTICAEIGPCIQQQSYEVGAEFKDRFLEKDKDYARFFLPAQKEEKHLFDLSGFIEMRLIKSGLSSVHNSKIDTRAEEKHYFSHRRATLQGAADQEGRQLSAILIKE